MPVRTRHRRRSPAEIKTILSRYHRSGLSQREFVRRHGLVLGTFTRWLRLSRNQTSTASHFVQVAVPQVPPAPDFELVLPDGRRLGVPSDFDPAALRRLLEVLATC